MGVDSSFTIISKSNYTSWSFARRVHSWKKSLEPHSDSIIFGPGGRWNKDRTDGQERRRRRIPPATATAIRSAAVRTTAVRPTAIWTTAVWPTAAIWSASVRSTTRRRLLPSSTSGQSPFTCTLPNIHQYHGEIVLTSSNRINNKVVCPLPPLLVNSANRRFL